MFDSAAFAVEHLTASRGLAFPLGFVIVAAVVGQMRRDMVKNSGFEAARAALLPQGGLRVWSLLVTIFGDLARDPLDRIDGAVLMRLTAGMDIKPEAVRVALHRLRNDDWIASQKRGRRASHALTAKGRRESEAASPLIYAAPDELPQGWKMLIAEDNSAATRGDLERRGFVAIAPRIYAGADTATEPEGLLVLPGDAAPNWMRDQLVAPEIVTAYRDLSDGLQAARDAGVTQADLSPTQTAIIRCLIVHEWRRLVLRHPYLPPALMGETWPGHLCRESVTDLLAHLPRPPIEALSAD